MKHYQTYKFNEIRRQINNLVCSGTSEKDAVSFVMAIHKK